jgi:type II secretory pathway component PulF
MLLLRYFPRVTKKEIALFSHQLGSLLASKIAMLKALDVYLQEVDNVFFKAIIGEIKEKIKNGQSFSASISKYPQIFPSFYQALVKTGEDSGSLDNSLKLIASYYTQEMQLTSKIKSALAYPLLIFVVGVITLLFIFIHVMPKIIPIFDSLDIEKPWATRLFIAISSFLQNNWVWLLLGLVILFLIFKRAVKNKAFLYYLSSLRLSLPIIGNLRFKSDIVRFSRALEIALTRGVPVVSAIKSVTPILTEYRLRYNLQQAHKELSFGRSVKDIFLKAKVFSPFMISLINVGEESGKLANAFADIADVYEGDCQDLIKTLTNLLEPLMVLIVGLFVGFVVAAVLMPVLNLDFIKF